MRRKDREVASRAEILEIIKNCETATLALLDGAYPYAVVLNFGWEEADGKLRLYFHCAKEGKKLDLIRQDSHAAFSMSCNHTYVPGKNGTATFRYRSVCGRGVITVAEGAEKARALNRIMAQYEPGSNYAFDEKITGAVCILRLDVEELTGKQNL